MSNEQGRPDFIKHYTEIQDPDQCHYLGSDELLSIGSPFSKAFGLAAIGVHHELLPAGRRTSFPHAESAEEEFVYVIEGMPLVWIDGVVHQLRPGDGVGFRSGTGIAHTFINNTVFDVRLLVVGEANKSENRVIYPVNQELHEQKKSVWWENAPQRDLGPHDGRPSTLSKELRRPSTPCH
jgi:uncharacterized cupin superfamily protein